MVLSELLQDIQVLESTAPLDLEIGGVSYDFGDDGYCEYRSIEE